MAACNNALDVAIAFTEEWTGHDIDTAADYVADDVVFDGPMQQSTGQQSTGQQSTGKITRDQMTLDSHQAHNANSG